MALTMDSWLASLIPQMNGTGDIVMKLMKYGLSGTCACLHACVCARAMLWINNKVILLLASQYLEVKSSIDFNSSQFNKFSIVISSSLEHNRQFGEGSIPILWRCLLKQSWSVISLDIATAGFLGTFGIMPGIFKKFIHF